MEIVCSRYASRHFFTECYLEKSQAVPVHKAGGAALKAWEKSKTGFKSTDYFMRITPARWGEMGKYSRFLQGSFLLQSSKKV